MSLYDLYTNSNNPSQNRFEFAFKYLAINNALDIAVPFFSNTEVLEEALKNGCEIRLIVKLGSATNPEALEKFIEHDRISIRYFTQNFHSKLYVFGKECAYVGSSNLTRNGLFNNSEINIMIAESDPRFEILKDTFSEYWSSAAPLTKDILEKYSRICDLHQEEEVKKKGLDSEVIKEFGHVKVTSNATMLTKNKDQEIESIKKFLQDYQIFLKKFKILREIYELSGLRKVNESQLAIRLEIDQFLNWIRVKKAKGESYLAAPIRYGEDLHEFVVKNIKEFIEDVEFQHIYFIRDEVYPFLARCLKNASTIEKLTEEELFQLFCYINAFNSTIRYHGGREEMQHDFFEENDIAKIKETLKYLFFGSDAYERRIAKCKYDEKYSLKSFGENSIKELFGWANNEDIPTYNNRTSMSLQWLGFGQV